MYSLLRCLFLYEQFGWQCLSMYETECNFQSNDTSRFSSTQTLPISQSLFSCLQKFKTFKLKLKKNLVKTQWAHRSSYLIFEQNIILCFLTSVQENGLNAPITSGNKNYLVKVFWKVVKMTDEQNERTRQNVGVMWLSDFLKKHLQNVLM